VIALAVPFVAVLGVVAVCKALGLSRATWYRLHADSGDTRGLLAQAPSPAPRRSPRRLSDTEEQQILDRLHTARFIDKAPAEVYATLLDEGEYLGSIRTFYRLLARHQEVRERRAQRTHPTYRRPELLATRPNELWSWDITKLRGPTRGTYFHLYVILDVFSRYVVGWMVAAYESEDLAQELIVTACGRQQIVAGQLTLHADRGPSMTSHGVAHLLTTLGVDKSHSRPYVSDDNPYSEAQFKTLKYRPDFPNRFGSLEDARAFGRTFFTWYNEAHHHTGLALLTPTDVHHEIAYERIKSRDVILLKAYAAHPERFVHGPPSAPRPPTEVWINPPRVSSAGTQDGSSSCAPKEPGGSGGRTPAQEEGAH
jgi:putative transposase